MSYLPAPPESLKLADAPEERVPFYRRHIASVVAAAVVLAFLAAPWSFEHKAHAAMHGLCAQTPSHSFYFHGKALPFDGRMTGIYAGLLATVAILGLLGRHRVAGLPSVGAGIVLLGFFASMAVDGFNSLLTDLGKWHPYAPSNEYRLITGWMAGIGIGTILVMLVGMTFWRRPRTKESVMPVWWMPFALLLPLVPLRLLMSTGSDVVYYPLSLLLMVSAVVAFTGLVLVVLLMLRNRENQLDRFAQVEGMAALSMIVAILIILAIGGGRFWLEAITNAPALM